MGDAGLEDLLGLGLVSELDDADGFGEVGVGGGVEVAHHVLMHVVEVAEQVGGGGNAQALGLSAFHIGALGDFGEVPGLVQALPEPDGRLAVLADEVDDVVLGADVVPGVEAGRDLVVVVAPVELVVVEIVERGDVAIVQGVHEVDEQLLDVHCGASPGAV